MASILIVDDDEEICSALGQFVTEEGHTALVASNAADAIGIVGESHPDLVLMDIRLAGMMDGLEALPTIRQLAPEAYVVIMTAYGTSQTSIEAMSRGAFEYLTKPLDLDVIKPVIEKALEAKALSRAPQAVLAEEWEKYRLVNLVGNSASMQEVYKRIGLLTTNDVPVLLLGEKGVGKHLVARTIHFSSRRREKPFVVTNCRMLSETLLDRELFGRQPPEVDPDRYVVGRGKLETADGGTILFEDIDAMPPSIQVKLLGVLTDRAFDRGDHLGLVPVNVRIMAAADQSLRDAVRQGKFSEALYDRLRVITIELPPLRERPGDIPALIAHFIKRYNVELNKATRGLDERVMQLFMDHPWPANVSQLENAIKRASVLCRGEVITPDDIGDSLDEEPVPTRAATASALQAAVTEALRQRVDDAKSRAIDSAFHDIVAEVETILIRRALALTGGNQVKAAELLNLNRTTLRKKMQLYRL